ncbi:VWA domain-containing protein [Candidatus Saccharibacteria bacterium]|nr:VWA domain-containing protein [Candidatus Saccharibacteria bacterium]
MSNIEASSINIEHPKQDPHATHHIGSAALAQHLSEGTSNNTTETNDGASERATNPDLESDKKLAKQFIRRHGRLFSVFARDSSLNFVPNPNAETFSFHPKEFKIEAPVSWFANPEYTENELQFANYHELAHFMDMRKNPDAYLENFKQMEKDAESLAQKYHASHPDTQLESVKRFYYDELHGLYNVMDDIYVNNVVLDHNHFFDTGDGKAAVVSLYRDKLGFGKADLTGLPLHHQMIYSLLRDEMIGDVEGKSIVDERVQIVLNKKKLGKRRILDLIDTDLKPIRGALVDPAKRYNIIRTLIQPEFLALLEASLNDQEHKQNQNQNQEQDQNQEQNQEIEASDFDPFGDKDNLRKDRDLLDKGDNARQITESILESFKEADKIDKMSREERDKYLADKAIKEFDDAHGITETQRKESERIEKNIKSARKEMRKFWRGLIGKSIEYRQTIIHRQKRGRLNIPEYSRQYPQVIESEQTGNLRELEVYDRLGLEREIVDQPEQIDVSLLVDCSGSMDKQKIQAAKEAAALLMWSIKDFNDELEIANSKLRANTEVITFGSDFKTEKPFNYNKSASDNDADIIKSISTIDNNRGSTDDESPLVAIGSTITNKDRTRLQNKKLKKIIIEITDGSPDNPNATSTQVRKLAKEGVLMIGFQVGEVREGERQTFDAIWSNGDDNIKGIRIGRNVSELPMRLIQALSDSLNDILI